MKLSSMTQPDSANKNVTVVGLGLIGGSIGLKLRELGWNVNAVDEDAAVQAHAVELGAADQVGFNPDSSIVFIATPVGSIPKAALDALENSNAVVTDVGSTKATIASEVSHSRFVGGHPMAGSELDGLVGARKDMFDGALWILTPDSATSEECYSFVRELVILLGADCVTLTPSAHDEIVAQVSHVPHLAAASLMNSAADSADDSGVMLRLAAGGFRDMTRISAGRSVIWPDICFANSKAIAEGIDGLIDTLTNVKKWVVESDRKNLLAHLDSARQARLNLPVGFGPDSELSEIELPVLNQPGEIAAITALAAKLDVNIIDLEISHSAASTRGVMILLVETESTDTFIPALIELGYQPRTRPLDVVED